MDEHILDNIPFQLDLSHLMERLHIREDSVHGDELKGLADGAMAAARPKATYRVAYVESRDEAHVVVDGVTLASRVLRVNLEQAHRIFPYVATCGSELDDWSNSIDDILERYWADAIKEMALGAAIRALNADLAARYQPGRTSAMNPGSLEDWPLPAQADLFALLGSPEDAIGVQLSSSFLMIPTKSVSGIRFPTEQSFENCQLCPREECPGRRAPYDSSLYDRRYKLAAGV